MSVSALAGIVDSLPEPSSAFGPTPLKERVWVGQRYRRLRGKTVYPSHHAPGEDSLSRVPQQLNPHHSDDDSRPFTILTIECSTHYECRGPKVYSITHISISFLASSSETDTLSPSIPCPR